MLGRVLGRIMHRWMQVTRQFARQHGLSVGQLLVLRQVQFRGPCTVSDIAQRMGVTNAAASQLLDRLVEHGLIERQANPHDRRSRSIVLTPAGRRLLDEASRHQQAWLAQLITDLSPDEQALMHEALRILHARLMDGPPAEG